MGYRGIHGWPYTFNLRWTRLHVPLGHGSGWSWVIGLVGYHGLQDSRVTKGYKTPGLPWVIQDFSGAIGYRGNHGLS